ncbi:MAG: transglutaminase-like domain-containing protein [Lachnospiraceae bacterium]|nr:transglutaminase-like domain-containing protein [Lachnospiraceae bacterium]
MKALIKKKKKEQVYSEDICITARELVQTEGRRLHKLFSFGILVVLLIMAAAGFAGTFISAFSLNYIAPIFFPFLFVVCLFWAGFSRLKMEGVYRFLALLAALIAFSVLLLILQSYVISGFLETMNCVMIKLNEGYDGNLALYQVAENPVHITFFLIFASFLVAGVISAGVMYRPNVWCLMAVFFPLLAGVLLVGGIPNMLFLCLVMLSLVGTITASALKDPPTFWKEGDKEQFVQNMHCYESIRSKTVLFISILVITLAVPSFFLLKPGLAVPIELARESGMKAENGILQAVWSILPRVSGGRLKLSLEGTGGGVDDGTLGEVEGYYFGKVQALKLTAPERPEETVYLKGFVGSLYSGSRFDAIDEAVFLNAASNWKTQDNPGLYIQNLPFLRMMYSENVTFSENEEDVTPELAGEVATSAKELTVENLDANDAYTYLPYNAFLNEYYVMLAGDGAVEGQTRQDDIFSYYPRESYQEAMEEWMLHEDYHSVLDEAFISYENYAKVVDLQIPEDGLLKLQAECEAMELSDIEEIKEYVVDTLSQNYTFNRDVESLPEGKDFVEWFLYEKKEGYSTHFAAAATMMFRMFGVPARYVVGYVAPKSIFSRQTDGTYTAILEDDNAHAWTEIFLSGVGWVPVETTPGFVAMLEEADYEGRSAGAETSSKTSDDKEEEDLPKEEVGALDKPANEEETSPFGIWIIAGIVAFFLFINLLVLLFVHRQYLLKRRLGRVPQADIKENMKSVYKSFYDMLLFDGWEKELGCSDDAFPLEIAKKYKDLSAEQIESLAQMVLQAHYGYQQQGKKDLIFVRNAYIKLGKAVYKRQRLKKKLQFRLIKCYL